MRRLDLRSKAWLTISETMTYLSKSRSAVWQMAREGKIDLARDGGSDRNPRYKVSVASIDRYLSSEAERIRRMMSEGQL